MTNIFVKILTSVIACGILIGSNVVSYRYGVDKGIDAYHRQCYVGGLIVDEYGMGVYCQGVGKINPDMLQKKHEDLLDKSQKV